MRLLLGIIGYGWALIGLSNIVMMLMPGSAAAESGLQAFGLIVNMVLFILPGLAVGALGTRKAA